MLRALALCLSLCTLSILPALPARAEPVSSPPSLRLSALSLAATTSTDAKLTDLWIQRMAEARARREDRARWGVPLMLSGAAALGIGFAMLPDLSNTSRALFAASGALPALVIIPAALAAPPNKARWLGLGGFLFTAAFSAAGLVQAAEQKDCNGWCGNEKAVGWLSAGFLPSTLLLEMAFIDRGPSLKELRDYEQLPPNERTIIGRKLLARVDRAERKVVLLNLAMDLMSTGILGAGAAIVDDKSERAWLLGFGGATLGITAITTLIALLSKPRLEKLALGIPPASREQIFW